MIPMHRMNPENLDVDLIATADIFLREEPDQEEQEEEDEDEDEDDNSEDDDNDEDSDEGYSE
jgi:hypothetical protein